MLTDRQKEIFKSIVEEFISTAEPVASKTLMTKYNINYSSATIRNEMVELERLELIEKTHTSSGRIPSIFGYGYYVEHLMEKIEMENENLYPSIFINNAYANVEEAIRSASDIISQMTNLTSIVLGPDANEQRLSHIRLFPMDEHSAIAVFITDSGHTENKVFRFNDEVTIKDIETTTDIINSRIVGTKIKDVVEKLESIKPILKEVVSRHEILFNAFVSAFNKFANDNVYFSGENNMFYQPDFSNVDQIRKLMLMMDDHQIWRSISQGDADLHLVRSEKLQLSWIDELAVISTKLKVSDSESAKLLLVGPSRMDYEKIISLLEFLSDSLESIYLEGGRDEEE